MTRSQNGALLLSCAALSSATPCRFYPGAFLDHLIRPRQHIGRNRQADLLRSFQIDDELKRHPKLFGALSSLSQSKNRNRPVLLSCAIFAAEIVVESVFTGAQQA